MPRPPKPRSPTVERTAEARKPPTRKSISRSPIPWTLHGAGNDLKPGDILKISHGGRYFYGICDNGSGNRWDSLGAGIPYWGVRILTEPTVSQENALVAEYISISTLKKAQEDWDSCRRGEQPVWFYRPSPALKN